VTMNLRDDKYDMNQEITLLLKPNQVNKRCRRMMLSVDRLKLVEEIIAVKVLSETVFNYTFGEFRQE